MCVDFKDCDPLLNIDQLVDSTSRHELLSFMDALPGYHQIRMVKEDEEKTSFVTHQGPIAIRSCPLKGP